VGAGSVVPQRFWTPNTVIDVRRHLWEAELQLPVFFLHQSGSIGLTVEAAMNGQSYTLVNANYSAPLGISSETTTIIRIGVSVIYSAVVNSSFTESATTF
jgi:hypothetical protein